MTWIIKTAEKTSSTEKTSSIYASSIFAWDPTIKTHSWVFFKREKSYTNSGYKIDRTYKCKKCESKFLLVIIKEKKLRFYSVYYMEEYFDECSKAVMNIALE